MDLSQYTTGQMVTCILAALLIPGIIGGYRWAMAQFHRTFLALQKKPDPDPPGHDLEQFLGNETNRSLLVKNLIKRYGRFADRHLFEMTVTPSQIQLTLFFYEPREDMLEAWWPLVEALRQHEAAKTAS